MEDVNYKSYVLKRRHLLIVPMFALLMFPNLIVSLQSSRLFFVVRISEGGDQQDKKDEALKAAISDTIDNIERKAVGKAGSN